MVLISLILIGAWAGPGASASTDGAAHDQQDGEPLLFAFYYTWFDESTWYSNTLSDQPIQPYASRDRAIMGQHIEQAQRAGIDAFLVAWYGPGPNQTEPNLAALLEEAAARNFKIGILFETDAPTFRGIGDISAALQHARTVHMQHRAYIRVGGRPVMFFWRPYIYNVGTWTSVRNQVDPSGSQIWISEGVDVSYLSTFNGHHLYSNTWTSRTDLGYTNQKFAGWVQNAREKFGKRLYWVSTVMPGYDDVRIRPTTGYRTSREGGAYYERGWRAAIESKPDWIVINSFNEWPEGTYIEPSVTYGNTFIDLTAAWSQKYTRRTPYVHPRSPAAPLLNTATNNTTTTSNTATNNTIIPTAALPIDPISDKSIAIVDVDLLNLRAQPNTASYVVAQLSKQMQLPALARSGEWIQVGTQQFTGWVYGPLVRLQSLAETQLSPTIETTPTQTTSTQTLSSNESSKTDPAPSQNAEREQSLVQGSYSGYPVATVAVASLNLRSKPTTDSPVIRLLLQDMALTVVDLGVNDAVLDKYLAEGDDFEETQLKNATWLQVEYDELSGWIYSPMVQISGDLSAISKRQE